MSGQRNAGWAGDTDGDNLSKLQGGGATGRSPSCVVLIACSTPSLHSVVILV